MSLLRLLYLSKITINHITLLLIYLLRLRPENLEYRYTLRRLLDAPLEALVEPSREPGIV
jgi:hypothetical protein